MAKSILDRMLYVTVYPFAWAYRRAPDLLLIVGLIAVIVLVLALSGCVHPFHGLFGQGAAPNLPPPTPTPRSTASAAMIGLAMFVLKPVNVISGLATVGLAAASLRFPWATRKLAGFALATFLGSLLATYIIVRYGEAMAIAAFWVLLAMGIGLGGLWLYPLAVSLFRRKLAGVANVLAAQGDHRASVAVESLAKPERLGNKVLRKERLAQLSKGH